MFDEEEVLLIKLELWPFLIAWLPLLLLLLLWQFDEFCDGGLSVLGCAAVRDCSRIVL